MHIAYDTPREIAGGLIIRLDGALNALTADQLWETASQLIGDDARYVVCDFTRVTMLTSAGLGILVRLYTRLQGLDGGLAIFGCNPKVRGVISIVMLDKVFPVRDTESEAWQALTS
jgi:anti-anti-sigma factor